MRPDLRLHEHTLHALRQLPAEESPPFGWEEFKRRAGLRAEERGGVHRAVRVWNSLPGWAVAAGLAVLGAGLVTDEHRPATRSVATLRAPAASGAQVVGMEREAPGVERGAVQSEGGAMQGLEQGQGLADTPEPGMRWTVPAEYRQPAIVHVDTQVAVLRLEDRIAAVDDLMTAARLAHPQAQQVLALQRDRDQMVESLEQIRRAQLLVAEAQ